MKKRVPTFNEFVNAKEGLDSNENGQNAYKPKKFPSIDDFVNGRNLLDSNSANGQNAEVIVHSPHPLKSEKTSLTDKEGIKYELYELNKEVSGLPIDIFVGYRQE